MTDKFAADLEALIERAATARATNARDAHLWMQIHELLMQAASLVSAIGRTEQ
jgi:hypothetical protein